MAVLQIARHDPKQVGNLLLAAPMRDEPAVLDPVGETHARLQSRRVSCPSPRLKESDSLPRAFRGTHVAHRLDTESIRPLRHSRNCTVRRHPLHFGTM